MEPPDEIGGDAIIETTPANAECPDPEDIAAFLDGKLPASQQARLFEHLASCESCYEAFAGAARFLEDNPPADRQLPLHLAPPRLEDNPPADSQQPLPQAPPRLEDDPPADSRHPLPQAPPRPFDRPDRRRERVAPRWRAWRYAAVAVAAMLAVAVGLPLFRWLGGGAELSTERLASLVSGPGAPAAEPWQGRVMRGQAEPAEVPADLQSFRLGVRFLDLHLALAADNRGTADEALRRMDELLQRIDFLPAGTLEAYKQMRAKVQDKRIAPHLLLAQAAALEAKQFKDLVEPRYVELGGWTEACRMAGKSGRPGLFRERATRRVLDQAIRPDAKEPSELPPAAIETLRTLDEAVAAGHPDTVALGKSCEKLLEQLDFD